MHARAAPRPCHPDRTPGIARTDPAPRRGEVVFPRPNEGACSMNLRDKKVLVTGGGGFLGKHVVHRLRSQGYRHVFVPRSSQYDLTQEPAIRRLLAEQR